MNIDQLKKLESNELYESVLEWQGKVNAADARAAIQSVAGFDKVRNILDAGCGPGLFADTIKELVADKNYLGIDANPKFIEKAQARLRGFEHIHFETADIYQFQSGSYELVLLYAVLQHLPSAERALNQLDPLLKRGGHILILDASPDGSAVVSDPAIPTLATMYSTLLKISIERGRNVQWLPEVTKWAEQHGYSVEFTRATNSVVNIPEQREALVRYSLLMSEILERFYQLKTDQRLLARELEAWKKTPNANARQIGGTWLALVKN